MEATTVTFYHADHLGDQLSVSITLPAHSDHCLHIEERGGCSLAIFLRDCQLRQLLGVINERLGLISVAQYPGDCERAATTACTCIHHAGDNARCVVHGGAQAVPGEVNTPCPS